MLFATKLEKKGSLDKAIPDDFLPYPKLKDPNAPIVLNPSTKKTLDKLAQQRRIPIYVLSRLSRPPTPGQADLPAPRPPGSMPPVA